MIRELNWHEYDTDGNGVQEMAALTQMLLFLPLRSLVHMQEFQNLRELGMICVKFPLQHLSGVLSSEQKSFIDQSLATF